MTLLVLLLTATILPFSSQGTVRTISLSGHDQRLHLYGRFTGPPVILSSGDGGWMHLAPHVAETLAARGYFVIGFDAKAYLSSGSSSGGALSPAEISRDFGTLLSMFAVHEPAVLAGVSEGAGLSLAAAADAANHPRIRGVVTYGLGERNELAWRWKDTLIYFTKGVPSEPTFNASTFIPRVAPVPLAFIRSSHDEFVSRVESDRLIDAARTPSKAWTISAADHRFSDNLAELDRVTAQAFDWIFATDR
jgi:type IV secretory pathway VirJ component